MALIIKAPGSLEGKVIPRIFLAGSIDNGTAEDWQDKLSKELDDLDIVIFNPRRDNWDATWKQTIKNPKFKEQVEWEDDKMIASDIIAMHFTKDSKSPITLLEYGLNIHSQKLIVYAEDGFYRLGNLEVLSDRYNIELVESWDNFIKLIRANVEIFGK